MASTSARFRFFLTAFGKRIRGEGRACPSCGAITTVNQDRKYGVLSLVRCCRCQLLFRTPVTTVEENARYYQTAYRRGFTTDLPDAKELGSMLANGFKGTEKDFAGRIGALRALGVTNGAKILDFGCSWGYGTWQMREAGFSPVGFELSKSRGDYAREKLGVTLLDDPWSAPSCFDVIYSSHVIEHLPDPARFISEARRALRPGGLFLCFCPNGSSDFRKKEPNSWHQLWGIDHPNYLDEEFLIKQVGSRPYLIASTPCDHALLRQWATEPSATSRRPLDSGELMVAFTN